MVRDAEGGFSVKVWLLNGTFDYKYRVNGHFWTTSQFSPTRKDASNNTNNFRIIEIKTLVHENFVGS